MLLKNLINFKFLFLVLLSSFFIVNNVKASDYANVVTDRDNRLIANQPTTSYGTSDFLVIGKADTGQIMRSIFSFTLPAYSGQIDKVELYIHRDSYIGWDYSTPYIYVYSLTRSNWTNSSTWNKYDGSNNWSTAGGDYSSTIIEEKSLCDLNFWCSFDLYGGTADNPVTFAWNTNYNFLLKSNESVRAFAGLNSLEGVSQYRPYLKVTYTAQVCGNSMVEGTEECDDGNLNDLDSCANDCTSNPYTGMVNFTKEGNALYETVIPYSGEILANFLPFVQPVFYFSIGLIVLFFILYAFIFAYRSYQRRRVNDFNYNRRRRQNFNFKMAQNAISRAIKRQGKKEGKAPVLGKSSQLFKEVGAMVAVEDEQIERNKKSLEHLRRTLQAKHIIK